MICCQNVSNSRFTTNTYMSTNIGALSRNVSLSARIFSSTGSSFRTYLEQWSRVGGIWQWLIGRWVFFQRWESDTWCITFDEDELRKTYFIIWTLKFVNKIRHRWMCQCCDYYTSTTILWRQRMIVGGVVIVLVDKTVLFFFLTGIRQRCYY